MAHFLVLDCETTGLKPRFHRIWQLSYLLLGADFEIEEAKNFYFEVDHMEEGAEAVHGHSVELVKKLSGGKGFSDYAEEIFNDFDQVHTVIAHNKTFDMNFTHMEMVRAGYDGINSCNYKEVFCTMDYFTDICRLPLPWGGRRDRHGKEFKWPRLTEVMDFLNIEDGAVLGLAERHYGTREVTSHDARFDILATVLALKYPPLREQLAVEFKQKKVI